MANTENPKSNTQNPTNQNNSTNKDQYSSTDKQKPKTPSFEPNAGKSSDTKDNTGGMKGEGEVGGKPENQSGSL